VGETPASPEDQAKKAADDKTKPGEPGEKATVKDEAYWRAKFGDANKKLADDSHELDILQREYNLKQEQYYADPMAALKQDYSRQDLNDTRTKIDEKTAAVAQDKSDISSLEDDLHQAGGDPGWARPSDQPAQEQPAGASAPASAPAPAPAPAPAAQQ
jgi:chromosome segregation ATPase